ncbi:MAG: hypothetical protein R3F62_02270 [Planctomycetota bacterium]
MSETEREDVAPPRGAPEVAVEGAATRCPYCHESVQVDEEAWTVCARCLGRHHAGCWEEHGCCASCAHATPLTVGQPGPGRLAPLDLDAVPPLKLGAAYAEAKTLYRQQNLPLFVMAGLHLVLSSAVAFFVSGLTGAGLWSATLRTLCGDEPGRVGELFAHSGKYVALLLATLAVFALTVASLPLLLVGALVVNGGLGYTLPLIAERGLGVKDALRTSWALARKGGIGKHALLALLSLLPGLLMIVPGVGIALYAAALPFTLGAWAAAYRQLTGEGAARTKPQAKDAKDEAPED